MKRIRILSLLALALVVVPAFVAAQSSEGVQIDSQVQGTLDGVGAVNIRFTGVAAHNRSGQTVIFTTKQISAQDSVVGPISATLNPNRQSTGTLSSSTFPATHRQNFFLRISNRTLGTLISDSPLTLSATIQSSPPTATYKSVTTSVVFYREGDPNKRPVLTVNSVTSNVQPATSQTVNISSVVTANVGGSTTTVQFNGSGSNLLGGTSVLFTAKQLTAVNPGPLGPTTVTLDPRQTSSGSLGSETFPTSHTQRFFLRIQSQNLGTLIADAPVVLSAQIQACPPNAIYNSVSQPVNFYREGDPTRQTVLTVENVTSQVTPSSTTGN
ncbi:MAG TPA: hypothetical protein VE685_27075 [Thermoanaerobaculia bacterium]|nr:hypothetical protein [Thermoanaerobaculia bacterium]